jgi:O-Antigen ligase
MSVAMRARNARAFVVISYLAIGVLAAVMFVGLPHVPLAGTAIGLAAALALAIGPIAVPMALARPISALLVLWAALVPFDSVFAHGGVGPVEKLLGTAAGGAAILSMLIRRRGFAPPLSAGMWSAFALLAIASLWWAREPDYGVIGMQQFVGLLLVGVALSMMPADKTDLTALFCGIVGGGVAASVYALVLFAKTGHPLFIGASQTLIDHNHFGAALLLPLICATMAAISSANNWVRALCAVASYTCLAGMGVSQSRGAMIAFGVTVIYILWRSQRRWRLLPWVASLPILLAAIPNVVSRFNDPSAGDAAGRYEIWQIAFAAFKHHWFAGTGFGTFTQSYQAAFLDFAQSHSTAQRVQNPHNLIVEIAVELGVIGLPLVLFAWWCQFRALKIIGVGSGWADIRITIEAATIALAIMTLSLDLMQFKYTWLIFYSTWIVRAAYVNAASRQASVPSLDPALSSRRRAAAEGAAALR